MKVFKKYIKKCYIKANFSSFSGLMLLANLICFLVFNFGRSLAEIPMPTLLTFDKDLIVPFLNNHEIAKNLMFSSFCMSTWLSVMSLAFFAFDRKGFTKDLIKFPEIVYYRYFSPSFTYKDLVDNHQEIFSALEKHPEADYLIKKLSESLYSNVPLSDSVINTIHEHLNPSKLENTTLKPPTELIAEYSQNKTSPNSEQKLQFFEKQSQ